MTTRPVPAILVRGLDWLARQRAVSYGLLLTSALLTFTTVAFRHPIHQSARTLVLMEASLALALLVGLAWRRTQLGLPPALDWRVVVGLSAALLACSVAGPVRQSRDLWAYAMYGRMVSVHHMSPYTHVPADFPHDPFLHLVDPRWRHTGSVYGPLFVAYAALVSKVAGSSLLITRFAFKGIAGLSVLASVLILVRRRVDPTAVACLGLNPLVMLYSVGGGHTERLSRAIMVADAPGDRANVADRAEVEGTPPYERPNRGEEPLAQRHVARRRPRTDERGAFPGEGLTLVIGDGVIDRQRDRRHLRRWAQAQVDAQHIAVAVARLEKLDHPPRDPHRRFPGFLARATRQDIGIEDQDGVDVGGIVELARALFAERDGGEATHWFARRPLGKGGRDRHVERRIREAGQRTGDLGQVERSGEVADRHVQRERAPRQPQPLRRRHLRVEGGGKIERPRPDGRRDFRLPLDQPGKKRRLTRRPLQRRHRDPRLDREKAAPCHAVVILRNIALVRSLNRRCPDLSASAIQQRLCRPRTTADGCDRHGAAWRL